MKDGTLSCGRGGTAPGRAGRRLVATERASGVDRGILSAVAVRLAVIRASGIERRFRIWIGIAIGMVTACDVPVRDPGRNGLTPAGGAGATEQGEAATEAECTRGFAVVNSDYQSASVALLDRAGGGLTPLLISSGSVAPELSAALGGDVVLPTERAGGDNLVLIDRYPASVLTWVDLETTRVSGQLAVATGFMANPHDYVALAPNRAYVTRFESNPAPGAEPFDAGGDLLVVDPSVPAITGRIDLSAALADEPAGYLPHPDRAVRVGERVLVLLAGYSADYTTSAMARIVAVDGRTDSIDEVLVLDGIHGCSGLAMSPDASELSLACSGEWGGDGTPDLDTSALVRVRTTSPLAELARTSAEELGGDPVGMSVSYASRSHLVFTTLGRFADAAGPAADDALLELDLESGEHHVLLRSASAPFTLGDVRCDPVCGVCMAADAGREGGVVHHFTVDDAGLGEKTMIEIDDGVGLPPRWVGTF
ncbi:MAG: hypothetical protein JW751_09275 [Polyangiaceae bacterium]|nr:hypothetical protein [Polyangiaceae bacterium]